jgi:branched-chain amino acid transport system substrate-binding protein
VEPVQERQWVFKTAQSDIVRPTNKMMSYLKEKGSQRGFSVYEQAYGDGAGFVSPRGRMLSG